MSGQFDEMPRADAHGDYGYSRQIQREGNATSCNDCKHDNATVVEGEHILCQRKGGGKDDLSCWSKREIKQGGKVTGHVELRGRPRGGGGATGSSMSHMGVSFDTIRRETGLGLHILSGRVKSNPNISLEKLRKPVRKKAGPRKMSYKGVLIRDIGTKTGISVHTLLSRIERNPGISLEKLSAPLKDMGQKKVKKC